MSDQLYCFYCGDFADQKDHPIPISYTSATGKRKASDDTVPCCMLCNSFKGDRMFKSYEKIASYLIERYNKKFRKLLSLSKWYSNELTKHDYALKDYIVRQQNAKELVRAKLENLIRLESGLRPHNITRLSIFYANN